MKKQNRPRHKISAKKSNQKDKDDADRKKPNFVKTFFLTFWITGTSTEFLMWITDGLVTWVLNSALTKFASSVIVSAIILVIRIVFYQTKPIRSKYMSKISNFFKRCGAYIKANKRTFGGILTSLLSGAGAVTVTVLGYTMNLTDLISQVQQFAWIKAINIKGFDIAPLITLVIWGAFVAWNTVAAVSRGWETPEVCAEKNQEEELAKAEEKRLKADEEEQAKARAEAEAEIKQAKAEAEAAIKQEQYQAEEEERKKKLEAEEARRKAAEKAKEEAHRKLVEKYKAELLAKQKGQIQSDEAKEENALEAGNESTAEQQAQQNK